MIALYIIGSTQPHKIQWPFNGQIFMLIIWHANNAKCGKRKHQTHFCKWHMALNIPRFMVNICVEYLTKFGQDVINIASNEYRVLSHLWATGWPDYCSVHLSLAYHLFWMHLSAANIIKHSLILNALGWPYWYTLCVLRPQRSIYQLFVYITSADRNEHAWSAGNFFEPFSTAR